ncbi:MAG: response regulator, partial [Oscillibacter sp.]|nr:response regulator [Oscillibacter sp.]
MRVLVVEDEARHAATLKDMLEMDGYTVDACHDGESGLDEALSGIYDVCVLDVMLPKLDGFTVLQRLREAKSGLPVLLLTA